MKELTSQTFDHTMKASISVIPIRLIFILIIIFSSRLLFGQTNWSQSFDECGVEGSVTIYDYNRNKWMTNDIEDSQSPTLPASTFKIVNTLIALETGVVRDENEIIPWIDDYDTLKYGHRPNIYQNMSMKDAFKLSAAWVYIQLAKKIGKDRYKSFLTQIRYGNDDLSTNDPDFWNFGDFAVSPANQISVLIGIYEENLPFSQRSYKTLKEMMVEEATDDYVIRAKTGWTGVDEKSIGWWVGYIENDDNVFFFATRIIKNRYESNLKFGSCRKDITKKICKELGIL